MNDDGLCCCGRPPLLCFADPASRAGAVAMIAAQAGQLSVPLNVALDDACTVGTLNHLAALAAKFIATQRPTWLQEYALAPLRTDAT